MFACLVPFLGLKNIFLKRGNIIINLLATLISLILYGGYFVALILLVTYLIDKDMFGQLPYCNKNPSRSIIINGFCFPLCFRCLAITLTLFLFIPFFLFSFTRLNKKLLILAIICLLIGFLDGLLQYGFNIMSTNTRRVITGILGGFGISYILGFLILELKSRRI